MSFALKSNAPCKGCDDRATKCHINCAEYNEWTAKHKQIKANAVKTLNADKAVLEYQIDNVIRAKRHHTI